MPRVEALKAYRFISIPLIINTKVQIHILWSRAVLHRMALLEVLHSPTPWHSEEMDNFKYLCLFYI